MSSEATRILNEGYGPGAWHGADLKAAIGDVTPDLAFWRPAAGRHNIAEIALHHAWCARSVRMKFSDGEAEEFPIEGEDWFEAGDESKLSWKKIAKLVETQQKKLADAVAASNGSLSDAERLDLLLGVTCHAIYHAGQIQLIKRLREE